MAVRTDSDSILAILLTNYDSVNNPALTAFISIATKIVDRVVRCAAAKGITLDDDTLLQIETLLAAHFYLLSDPMYTSKSTLSASGSFHGQTGKGLEATVFGPQALLLDESGCLNAIMKGARASLSWLGKTDDEKLSYEERNG